MSDEQTDDATAGPAGSAAAGPQWPQEDPVEPARFVPLKMSEEAHYKGMVATLRRAHAVRPLSEHIRQLLHGGVYELRISVADLGDRDLARALIVSSLLLGQLAEAGPQWTAMKLVGFQLSLAKELWQGNTPGAAELLADIEAIHRGAGQMKAAVVDGPTASLAAFDALERLHARIHRDFNFDASESAAPDDERWARVMDDLVRFADEVYLPLVDEPKVETA